MKHFDSIRKSFRLLVLAVAALTSLSASAQDSVYVCRQTTLHAYPATGLKMSATTQQLSILRGGNTETYPLERIDSILLSLPSYYNPQAPKTTFVSETFKTDFGSFEVQTPQGTAWVIDYSTAKGTGYANRKTTASSSYLLSPSLDFVRNTEVTLDFDYILRYVKTGTVNEVLITDFYTGDPETTEWDTLSVDLSTGSNWTKFYHATVAVPERYIGCSHVRIAFHYACTSSGSATWEVKNVNITGKVAVPTVPDNPTDTTKTDTTKTDTTTVVTDNNVNRNRSANDQGKGFSYNMLELPHLSSVSTDLFIQHSTADYGITYSLEWVCAKKANRWTAYEMHEGNSAQTVKRKDAFREDDLIPEGYRSTLADYSGSGFSRGHLCPSHDRLCSREQNSQTFYLSNMQPQWQSHNGGLWERLEAQVRAWNTSSFRDTLYVVKAATIADDQVYDQTVGSNKLPVPKYFYMAILCVKDGKYKAIALWTVHENKSVSNKNYGDYAISIDELEKRTGIDFFCNLPDDIEKAVQKECNISDWNLTKSSAN